MNTRYPSDVRRDSSMIGDEMSSPRRMYDARSCMYVAYSVDCEGTNVPEINVTSGGLVL